MPNSELALYSGHSIADRASPPTDIEMYRVKLLATRASVAQFGRTMDGMVFGVIGADGVLSAIPVLGDIFCGLMTFWLLIKARQVRMSFGDRLVIFGLGVIDTVVGLVPGVGDVIDLFFRSHAWSSNRVAAHIDMQLAQIDAVGSLPSDHPQMDHLRDALFRGGKTKQEQWIRLGVIGAICAAVLGYCTYQGQLRHERIMACEARGEWFCSWKN